MVMCMTAMGVPSTPETVLAILADHGVLPPENTAMVHDLRYETAERLADALDSTEGFGIPLLREDFPNWRIWFSVRTGRFHARRNDPSGRFEVSQFSARRFHVDCSTPGRLAVMLLAQLAADEIERVS